MSLKRIGQAGRAPLPIHHWKRWIAIISSKRKSARSHYAALWPDILTDDPRSTRFVVRGTPPGEDREIEVVCRFLPSGLLRIITVYEVKE